MDCATLLHRSCMADRNIDKIVARIQHKKKLGDKSLAICARMVKKSMSSNLKKLNRPPNTKEECKILLSHLNDLTDNNVTETISRRYPSSNRPAKPVRDIHGRSQFRDRDVWGDRQVQFQPRSKTTFISTRGSEMSVDPRQTDDSYVSDFDSNDDDFMASAFGSQFAPVGLDDNITGGLPESAIKNYQPQQPQQPQYQQHPQHSFQPRNTMGSMSTRDSGDTIERYEKLLESRGFRSNERPPTPDFSLDGSGSKSRQPQFQQPQPQSQSHIQYTPPNMSYQQDQYQSHPQTYSQQPYMQHPQPQQPQLDNFDPYMSLLGSGAPPLGTNIGAAAPRTQHIPDQYYNSYPMNQLPI